MNPYEPPQKTAWNIINLGAGVQSSALALMAAHGVFDPMPDAAIFADTGAEPKNVYTWLDWLEKELPFPLYRVKALRQLEEDSFRAKTRKKDAVKYVNWTLPVFTNNNGKINKRVRHCTHDYKIVPIKSKIKKLVKRKRNDYTLICTQWFGISLDEVQRTRISQDTWCQYRYPLIERRLSRGDCLTWMKNVGYPEPPRSACVMCPYHSDAEWLRLKKEDPDGFQRAVDFEFKLQVFDDAINTIKPLPPFLHRSCVPLDKVIFKGEETSFNEECDGMCGV